MSIGSSSLASLYRGALIGQSLSKQLGETQAQLEPIDLSVRANLIQTGVATGKINPASLSSSDASLLKDAVANTPPKITIPSHGGGGILGALETPFKVITNTASDLTSALAGIPQGLATVGEAAYRTFNPVGNAISSALGLGTYKTPQGPNLADVGKGIVQSTAHDFTNFDPMHPLYPLLDIAGAASLGAGTVLRGAGAAARLGEFGAEGSSLAKVGATARKVAQAMSQTERPGLVAARSLDTAEPGTLVPTLPAGNYSISPFRRFFVEKPIDMFFQSGLAGANIPGLPEGTSLQDLRANYHIRRITNATRGRTSSTAIGEAARATQPFNEAMHGLLQESGNEAVAAEKFNALVLRRMLAADHLGPEESLGILDQYREKVLATGTPEVEGVPVTEEMKAIRQYYRNLTASGEFRRFFSRPTEAMSRIVPVWDEAVLNGLQKLNIDPNEILNRSLGPAAHILNKTPEEMLREQPSAIQASMNFARGAHELEQALREHPNDVVQETALIPKLALYLPGNVTLAEKIQLIHDAFNSVSEDIGGHFSRRELLNNADKTGYLPGNNLAQKVAMGLRDRFGVDPTIAEPFATGGLTNYFPSASALGTKRRPQGGPIARTMSRLTRDTIQSGARREGLHEFRHENTMRLLKAESLGVAPFASFLQDSDLAFFKAGVDRRDPITFARHINQRERVLAHRLLNEPLVTRLALKGSEGEVLTFKSDAELQARLGSTVAASKWRLLPNRAIQALIQSEDEAGKEIATMLQQNDARMTPELMQHFDTVIDENAQMFTRQLSDEVIRSGDGMIAVPTSYVSNLIKHAQVIDSARGAGHLWQGFINRWRTAVLAYMPSWLLRTSMGHGVLMFIGGVWNPVHFAQAMHYFGEGFKVPGTDIHLSRGLERDVPAGVEQGSPHTDFGRFGMQHMSMAKLPQYTTHGVHAIMNFQRRAAFLSILRTVERQNHWTDLGRAMDIPRGFLRTENIDKVIHDHPEWVHHTINELDRISYTFGQMSPWERRLAKNILPFWGWYKFVSKFVWSLPLTYPGRALALTRLGQLGSSQMDQLGSMPDWLRSSLMFNTHNLSAVHYLSMLGLNPLGDVMNPGQGFQGLVRLGQMSPVIQAALEGAGYNTLTGGLEMSDPSSGIVEVNGKYINLHTGQEADSPGFVSPLQSGERAVGGLMRAFPEIRIGEEVVTGGRPIYPESLPLINERIIPSRNPPKDVSPAGIALQYMGVAPKTYNLQKYQASLLKDIVRARTAMYKAIGKEKALK